MLAFLRGVSAHIVYLRDASMSTGFSCLNVPNALSEKVYTVLSDVKKQTIHFVIDEKVKAKRQIDKNLAINLQEQLNEFHEHISNICK